MEGRTLDRLQVEFYLADAQLHGVVPRLDTNQGRRLVDLLSGGDETVELREARVTIRLDGSTLEQTSVSVKKADIVMAVPR